MNDLKVAFFTEAGTNRGMGHLVRSYTIYEKFSENFDTDFFLDSDVDFSDNFSDIKKFQWNSFFIEKKYDVIFIDSYLASSEIYSLVSKSCELAIYIDDFGRINYPKGFILNFAPEAKELFFKEEKKENRYLLGLKYIPIRKELLAKQEKNKEKILISFGGFCDDRIYLNILEQLKEINEEKVIISNSKTILKKIEKYKDVKLISNPKVEELSYIMASSRLAICTASMTAYELNYLEVPSIILALSENQEIGAEQFIRNNLAFEYIDTKKLNCKKNVKNLVSQSLEKKVEVSRIVDGLGATRVLEYVLKEFNK